MLPINHAASALLIKKNFPGVNIVLILICIQLMDILWIALCFLGVEFITTSDQVKYMGDINRTYMPYSHSLLSSVVLSLLAYIIIKVVFKNRLTAIAASIAIFSHIILDMLMYDIPVLFFDQVKIGTNLWASSPYLAFYLELTFGFFCWWYYRGTRKLLAVIILFNIISFTAFSPDIIGFEQHFANKTDLILLIIFSLTIVTLILIGFLSRKTIPLEHEPHFSPQNSPLG
jgi:hypothetical protein